MLAAVGAVEGAVLGALVAAWTEGASVIARGLVPLTWRRAAKCGKRALTVWDCCISVPARSSRMVTVAMVPSLVGAKVGARDGAVCFYGVRRGREPMIEGREMGRKMEKSLPRCIKFVLTVLVVAVGAAVGSLAMAARLVLCAAVTPCRGTARRHRARSWTRMERKLFFIFVARARVWSKHGRLAQWRVRES